MFHLRNFTTEFYKKHKYNYHLPVLVILPRINIIFVCKLHVSGL